MKTKRLRFLPLAVFLCTLCSCSGKLSREQAAKSIIEHYDFPSVEVVRITGAGYASQHLNFSPGYNLFGSIPIGESSDLFSFEDRHRGIKALTEKGNKYLAPAEACQACISRLPKEIWGNPTFYCVAANIWEFKDVTGITDNGVDGNTITVEYMVVATRVNLFGEYKGRKEGMRETRKVTMKKYDDGSWRVEDSKPAYVVKPADISFYADNNQ